MTDEKRREKPLREKRYLYYIYNNLYVHVRDSVDDFDDNDDFGNNWKDMKKIAKVAKVAFSIYLSLPS